MRAHVPESQEGGAASEEAAFLVLAGSAASTGGVSKNPALARSGAKGRQPPP